VLSSERCTIPVRLRGSVSASTPFAESEAAVDAERERIIEQLYGNGERRRGQPALDGPANRRPQPAVEEIDHRWLPRPLSVLSPEGTEAPWLLRGYLARGAFTNFTGLWKIGKTTWLSRLLKALDGREGDFCGEPVTATSALVISEESDRLWAVRRDDIGIGDHVGVITRPFLRRPDTRSWERFLACVASEVTTRRYGIVVFDALPNLWPVRDENDAAGVIAALMPLNALTEGGAAVLLMTHPAKTDAGEGRATRGTGALPGFIDVIVEMRRLNAERREDTRRTLTAYSRFEETPPERVLAFDRDRGYSVVGTKADAKAGDRLATLMELLPGTAPGETPEELLKRWPADGPSRPGIRTIKSDLATAVMRNTAQRTGSGTKGDPHRFYVLGENSIPASSPPYTPGLQETNPGPLEGS
jgi:hypothetical protein